MCICERECMCVCACVFVGVCMCVCVCERECMCVYVCVRVRECMRMCVRECIRVLQVCRLLALFFMRETRAISHSPLTHNTWPIGRGIIMDVQLL